MRRRPNTWLAIAAALLLVGAGCRPGGQTADRAEEERSRPEATVSDEAVDEGAVQPEEMADEAADETVARAGEVAGSMASGVEAFVTISPACPVVTPEGCPPLPFEADMVVRDATSGAVVVNVASSADGRFRVDLEPGSYVLAPAQTAMTAAPSADPVPFEVRAGRYTQVEVKYDSGIR